MKRLVFRTAIAWFWIPMIVGLSSPEVIDINKVAPRGPHLPPQHINAIPHGQDYVNVSKPSYPQFGNPQSTTYTQPAQMAAHGTYQTIPVSITRPHQPQNTQQTNFVPMPALPTPVIMQYLPQGQVAGGVQYLQLIPTRPLIVPISPYLASQMTAQMSQQSPTILDQPPSRPAGPSSLPAGPPGHPNYSAGPPGHPNYSAGPPGSSNYPTYPTYSPPKPVGNYAPVYPFFKPNPGLEIIGGPTDLSLNMREYIPGPGDGPPMAGRAREVVG